MLSTSEGPSCDVVSLRFIVIKEHVAADTRSPIFVVMDVHVNADIGGPRPSVIQVHVAADVSTPNSQSFEWMWRLTWKRFSCSAATDRAYFGTAYADALPAGRRAEGCLPGAG